MRRSLLPVLVLSLVGVQAASAAVIQVRDRVAVDGGPGKAKLAWASTSRHQRTMERKVASGKTPSIAAFGIGGTGLRLVRPLLSNPPTYRVRGAGTNGGISLRVMMPVSADLEAGSGGRMSARTFAANTIFDVVLTRPDGSVHREAVPATGLVTRADLWLKLGTGDNVLEIAPRGATVGGFSGGRQLVLRLEGSK